MVKAESIGPLEWGEFVTAVMSVRGQWAYRGVLPEWKHETSLERLCRAWAWPLNQARDLERRLIREFRRHPEAQRAGVSDDDLGCLALMQHHGAPTRLLDWTYSPFVAAYFAVDALLEALKRPGSGPSATAVWAIDIDWLTRRIERRLPAREWTLYYQEKKRQGVFARLFLQRRRPIAFIGTATPLQLNERLSIQQGVFLCPGDIGKTWDDNLASVAGPHSGRHIIKHLIARSSMPEAFEGLTRMNVTARSLFPGLDGYSRGLDHRAHLLRNLRLPRV